MLQRQTMIYTELSPNPNSMKFVLNFELAPDGLTFDFPTVAATLEEGKASPLATDLFQFPYVVYDVKKFMKIYFEQNHPVFDQKTIEKNTFVVDVNDSEIVGKIKKALDEYVRPAVESDGGAINFASFDEISGQVKVYLQGSCSGCPSSTVTLKDGIERLLKTMVPEVKEVVAEGV